jgi:hypothetical protein
MVKQRLKVHILTLYGFFISYIHTLMYIYFFSTGICYTDEYACSNGHCIANNISCNGFNPCGDYSDCGNNVISGSSSRVFNVGGIIGGVISAVTALVIIVIVAVVVVKRQNRRPCVCLILTLF